MDKFPVRQFLPDRQEHPVKHRVDSWQAKQQLRATLSALPTTAELVDLESGEREYPPESRIKQGVRNTLRLIDTAATDLIEGRAPAHLVDSESPYLDAEDEEMEYIEPFYTKKGWSIAICAGTLVSTVAFVYVAKTLAENVVEEIGSSTTEQLPATPTPTSSNLEAISVGDKSVAIPVGPAEYSVPAGPTYVITTP